jgi:hypothetical protein
LKNLLADSLAKPGERNRVLAVPPDQSRPHSRTGELTRYARESFGEKMQAVLPALGTHTAMQPEQTAGMVGVMPQELFRVHNWRTDVETSGEGPSAFIDMQSEGKWNFAWPARANRRIARGGFDLILSIGQVVPHEVIGVADHNKNILVGTGGRNGINRSHYLGAAYGMERIRGRAAKHGRNRHIYACDHLPIVHVLTLVVCRLFVGDDAECLQGVAALSWRVNIQTLGAPIRKAVVYLDPHEFHSIGLDNKAVHRTRMVLADGAELIILAPAVKEFGEDKLIDGLICRYDYRETTAQLHAVSANADLANDLSTAAHLIHGSPERRFTIRWCSGHLSIEEIEGVGFKYGDLKAMLRHYDSQKLQHGGNRIDGEEVFFIANPGLGLWAHHAKLQGEVTNGK